MSETIQLSCPNCGSTQQLPKAKIPKEGAWGRCGTCRERVFISLDLLSPSGAGPQPAEPPSAPEAHGPSPAPFPPDETSGPNSPNRPKRAPEPYQASPAFDPLVDPSPPPGLAGGYVLKLPDGKTIPSDTDQLLELVRSGQVYPWDLVSHGGEKFRPIQKQPDFLDAFREFRGAIHVHCWNHTEVTAELVCGRCQRGYCNECLPKPTREGSTIRECAACAGLLKDADPRFREKPFWKRPIEVLTYPLRGDGILLTLALALVFFLASQLLYLLPLHGITLVGLLIVVLESASGARILSLDKSERPKNLAGRAFIVLAVTVLLSALPLLFGYYFLGSIGTFIVLIMAAAAFGYFPMAVGMAALNEETSLPFQPREVWAAIKLLSEDYVLLLVGLAALGVGALLLGGVLRSIAYLGAVLAPAMLAYGSIAQAHIVGWTFHLGMSRLGWRR